MARKPLAALLADAGTTPDMPMMDETIITFDGEPESLVIDLQTGAITDGSEAEETTEESGVDHDANLAEHIDDEALKTIGAELIGLVDGDAKEHAEWYATIERGFKNLGIYRSMPEQAGDLTDADKIFHPLLLEAATQFQARAMAELLPPGGPVKATVAGKQTKEKLDQALRVEQHMNYQLTVEDRGYYDDKDQMFYRLGFTGSEFDKQWNDPVKKQNRSRWVKCENFIVPTSASSLEDAPRYAEKLTWTKNQFRKMVVNKFYRDIELSPSGASTETNPITQEIQKLQGEDVSVTVDGSGERDNYCFYEIYVEYDLPGFEDPDGIALPYVITVDKDSQQVVSIYRNWREDDPDKNKRIWHTHKKFLPGLGFYGWGLFHCIGGLGETATTIVNLLLDGGAFASFQGGFKSKDAKLPGDVTIDPGEWKDTELTAEELQKAFYTPPYKEPSQTLHLLLGAVVEMGQRFAATTDTMVGDAASTGPVGTTVALIEQGSKVYTGIHKRLHKAMGDEFIHLATLNGENLPEDYPYEMEEEEQSVLRSDYDGRVDIIPVSDPNIFSSAQRLATAQAIYQMAQTSPYMDRREAEMSMLRAMRAPDAEKLLPTPAEAKMNDPLTEGVLVIAGRPIKAFLQENHGAHIATHQMQITQFQQMNPQAAQQMMAHLQEHMAMSLYIQYSQQLGMPLPSIEWSAKPSEPMTMDVPPQIQDQIALQAAQMAQEFMMQMQQAAAAQQEPQGGAAAEDPAETARKDAAFQQEQSHKDEAFQRDQARKDAEVRARVGRDDFTSDSNLKVDPEILAQAKKYVEMSGVQIPPKKLAVMSQVAGKPFDDIIKALSIMMMEGQGAPAAAGGLQAVGEREYQ